MPSIATGSDRCAPADGGGVMHGLPRRIACVIAGTVLLFVLTTVLAIWWLAGALDRIERHGDILRSHLPYRPVLIGNPALPALHGGVTAAFMENAAMLHLLLQPGQDRIPKIIDFAIDYLLPGRPQDCYAECRVGRAGLRIAQTQIRCWQGDPDRPIAIARAHFLLASP